MKSAKLLLIVAALGVSQSIYALDQIFQIDTGSGSTPSGTAFSVTLVGLTEGSVTFDATLSVTGSGTLTQNTSGLGISVDSSDLVSNGESLFFTMAVNNEVGGSIAFDGFTDVDFNNFGSSDIGVLSSDALISTGGDNFFSTVVGAGNVDISGTLPTQFYAIARADGAGTNSFRIDDVTARFSVVPEPNTYALLAGLSGIFFVMLKRRRG